MRYNSEGDSAYWIEKAQPEGLESLILFTHIYIFPIKVIKNELVQVRSRVFTWKQLLLTED
jgi:hypothetical protein